MTIWKKALSGATSAALLAGLFATALAPSAFAAASMTPTTGPAAGGTLVTISGGSGYSVATTITVDTTTVSPTSVSADGTSLTFLTPAHAAGLVAVATATPATVGLPGFLYTSGAPTPPTMAPLTGPTTGNTFVTISNGSGYVAGTTTVTVGGTAASVVFVSTDGKTLTFVTPAKAAGTYAVVTAAPATIGLPGFTYTAVAPTLTIAPTSGSAAGGTVVTIGNGSGFDTSCRVTIGTDAGVNPTSVSADGTSLTFITPGDPAGSVAVAVTSCPGADVAPNFTYTTAAATVSFSPTTGPLTGGTVVTIAGGTGFSFATRITLGTIANIVPTSVNAAGTSLTFVTPAKPAADPAAAALSTTAPVYALGTFTYATPAAPPTVTAISPNSGPTAGGQSVVITGTGFAAGATVTIGGAAATFVGFVSSTTLTATTPAGVAGATSVIVKNADGQSGALTGGYTYAGVVGIAGTNGSHLGLSNTGGFTTATKVSSFGGYQTWKISFGPAAAGKAIGILMATKNSAGVWSSFSRITARTADSAGNAYFHFRSLSAKWVSVRGANGATISPAVQGRWR